MATFIFGVISALLGLGMILKTEWLIENFGTSNWAEAKMGTSGGSRMLYKLIGLALIFIGFLLITGLFEGFLLGTIGRVLTRK